MAFFPNRLTFPCLQLLVLILVLGAALLPRNSMALDEGCANPDNTGGVTTSDRPIKPVKCWVQKCKGSVNCLKKASEPEATIKEDCPDGYCYQAISVFNYTNEQEIWVIRGCNAHKVNCLKKEPGHCAKLRFIGNERADEVTILSSDFAKCLLQAPDKDKSAADEEKRWVPGIIEACLCDKDLCNGGSPTLSTSTGVKHLGYNVVLVGALLMVVFSLQTMSLFG